MADVLAPERCAGHSPSGGKALPPAGRSPWRIEGTCELPRALPDVHLIRQPLLRLLVINLGIGVTVAILMLSGLLALNTHRLRDLILADNAGDVALGLLLFGLVATFGSTAMASAVMMLDRRPSSGHDHTAEPQRVPVRVKRPAR